MYLRSCRAVTSDESLLQKLYTHSIIMRGLLVLALFVSMIAAVPVPLSARAPMEHEHGHTPPPPGLPEGQVNMVGTKPDTQVKGLPQVHVSRAINTAHGIVCRF
jgi:hypothetical protein